MPLALLFQVWSIIKTLIFVFKEIKSLESLIHSHKATTPGQPILRRHENGPSDSTSPDPSTAFTKSDADLKAADQAEKVESAKLDKMLADANQALGYDPKTDTFNPLPRAANPQSAPNVNP